MEDPAVRLKNSILDLLSQNKEAYFKSQQKDEPDLSTSEKWKIAEDILNKSAPTFLQRYGKYLNEEHLVYFDNNEDYEVRYYVEQRRAELKKATNKSVVRNRRLEALKRMAEDGEYFSDKEMKRRNPLLFEELVGQFLTNDEKFHFETTGGGEPTSFANYFMDIVEKDYAASKLKKEVESDASMMPAATCDSIGSAESSPGVSRKVVLWGEMAGASAGSKQMVLENSRLQEVTEDEKTILLNEFRSKVFSDFLGGKDDEFDYSEVDENMDYDDLCTIEQDKQEDYFDAESPKSVMDEDSNSAG
ncbi:hypothetical protein GE061_013272 [Apolygus lucorum]|uniref:CCD97-like C-terminal domain-containing protein n=1 Tax=Apolygus lucorum TaxID=248454 RepID=A0A6A4K3K5_APOLU|nr:hypothetical protein GE061_013272 [Apolygus lucorum]